MEPITTLFFQLLALARLIAVGGPLAGTQLILFSNNLSITKDTQVSDLVPCIFTGYAPVAALVFGTPYIDLGGNVRADVPSNTFVATSGTPVDTIAGWAILDTAGTGLVEAALLPVPVQITRAGDGYTVLPTYAYGD
jgi:hypothetical protein